MSKKSGEAVEPVKVFKWDGVAVKNALDDAIRDVSCSEFLILSLHHNIMQ